MSGHEGRGALAGVRVLETGHGYAVPYAARLMADMGADVIKLEAPNYPYNLRVAGPHPEGDMSGDYWNRAGLVHEMNRNKRALTLDLAKPRGRELLKELVAQCDVFAENFAPRVLINLGLGYDELRKVKPDLIMLSSTGYGHSGPYMRYAAWGDSLEPMSGISWLSGLPERPINAGMPFTDVPAAYLGAFAILAALRHRRRTGEGQWIDLAQYEVGTTLVAQAVAEYAMNERETPRMANHDAVMAPHNVYNCKGHDRFVAIACPDDATWPLLAAAIGRPEWADDARFADALSRKRNEGEIDAAIDLWAAAREDTEAFAAMRAAGVPAAPVMSAMHQLFDPQLSERGAFHRQRHSGPLESMGTRYYPANPWRFSRTPPRMRTQAAPLGWDSAEVLSEVLGLSPEAIAELVAKGITGTEYRTGLMKHDNTAGIKSTATAGDGPGHRQWRDADYRERLGLDDAGFLS